MKLLSRRMESPSSWTFGVEYEALSFCQYSKEKILKINKLVVRKKIKNYAVEEIVSSKYEFFSTFKKCKLK